MIKLYEGDCLEQHKNIKDGSVDLILTDLPYGTVKGIADSTNIKHGMKKRTDWDFAIDPIKIYDIANRVLRKNGKMVLFSQEPYSSRLINEAISNIPFNYRMIWKKDHFANALLANKAPVSYFEDIVVFSKTYDLEGLHPLREYFKLIINFIGQNKKKIVETVGQSADHCLRVDSSQFDLCTEKTYNKFIELYSINIMSDYKEFGELIKINNTFNSTFNLWQGGKYKSNVLEYKKDYQGLHPTQKPVLLLEDLIQTFSNEGNLVVDLTAGSGSTGVACINTNRNCILIEKEEKYCDIIEKRINELL